MKYLKLQTLAIAVAGTLAMTGCATTTHTSGSTSGKQVIVDDANYKQVGRVAWHKQADIAPSEVINRQVPNNMTSLVFMRRMDNDTKQTSANIAINDRFQVSLQPNGYTQVYSCAGMNLISAEPTGLKTNDLLKNSTPFELAPNGTYYFYVDVEDSTGNPSVVQITEGSATKILETKKYQMHQISRVVPNCPVVKKVEVPQKPKTPVLEREVMIELEVLFDTDKHFVKPMYYSEIQEVAEFMNAYSNTTTVIEGHTDSRAPTGYNQRLSQRRANAVKSVLVNKFGIAPNRIQAIGYGETRPRVPNDTPANLQKNRRVIAVINESVRIDENGNQIVK